MSHYATLFAHAHRLGVQAVISESMHSTLTKHFFNISLPVAAPDCPWNWVRMWLTDINAFDGSDLVDKNVMIYKYVLDLNALDFYRNRLISQEFSFRPEIVAEVRKYLRAVAGTRSAFPELVQFVSVHVRRTDFMEWMNQQVTRTIS